MNDFWLTEAVSNNAVWCDAIAASHGISSNWNESVWSSELPMPPLYPNIVTLTSDALIEELIDVLNPNLPVGWGIKDSYSELELDGNDFKLVFNAHWYCRQPLQKLSEVDGTGIELKTVKTQLELNRWVSAWGERQGIFNASLLKNNSIELVYVERDGNIVSGLATNQSGNAVGISNAFGESVDILCCVALVANTYPEKGIVGYGDKAEVALLSEIGFDAIGDLRVWLRR